MHRFGLINIRSMLLATSILSGALPLAAHAQSDVSDSTVKYMDSVTARTLASRFADEYRAADFGARCDGQSHPLSSIYASYDAAHVDYPDVSANYQGQDWSVLEVDAAAIQKAINLGQQRGRAIVLPGGTCQLNRTLFASSFAHIRGQGDLVTFLNQMNDYGPGIQFGSLAAPDKVSIATAWVSLSDLAWERTLTYTPAGKNRPESLPRTVGNSAYIKMVGVSSGSIHNISMISTFEGIQFVGGASTTVDTIHGTSDFLPDGTITNCTVASDGTATGCLSTKGAHYLLKIEQAPKSVGVDADNHPLGNTPFFLPTLIQVSNMELGSGANITTDPNTHVITNYQPLGPTYGFWIQGCEACMFSHLDAGHTQAADLLIELGKDDAAILDNEFNSFYFDSSANASVYMTAGGVPASLTHDGHLRLGGSGAAQISRTNFIGGRINGSTTGLDGLVIDGAPQGAPFVQGVEGTTVTGTEFSGHRRNCVDLRGGVGTILRGVHIAGCNYANSMAGRGVIIGANTDQTTIANSRIGGDALGRNSTAYQVYGVETLAGATGVKLRDLDLYANNAPLNLVAGNEQVLNLTDGYRTAAVSPSEGTSVQVPDLVESVAVLPQGVVNTAGVALPIGYEGAECVLFVTADIPTLLVGTKGGKALITTIAAKAQTGYGFRYIGGTWLRIS